MFFEMLDNCLEVFLNLIRDKEQKSYSIDTPKVVQELREKFMVNTTAKDQLNMVEHHSKITIDKHWEETMIHIIKCLTIISKKYLENNKIHNNQEPITVKIFESYLLLLRISKYEIFLEAVKGVNMIVSTTIEWTYDSVNKICEFLTVIGTWIDRKTPDYKEWQFIRGKAIPMLIGSMI